MKSKGFAPIIILILLALVAGGTYYFGVLKNRSPLSPTPIASTNASPSPIAKPTVDPTLNWKKYTNPIINFSFLYPNDWISTPGANLHAPDNSISMWIQTKTGGMECSILIKSKTSTIDGKSFDIQYFSGVDSDICSNPNERIIYFGQQSPFFTITYLYNQNNQKRAEEIFDQILSTFKFTK